jgi:transmembrane sensor
MEEKYTLAQWLNEEITNDDLVKTEASLDIEIYEKIKKYSSQLEAPSFNEDKMLATILATKTEAKQEKPVIQLKTSYWLKIAAALFIFFGLSFLFTYNPTQTQIAENGKKTTFNLPDNSEVVLNSGSEIEYKQKNWDENRKLDLKGEAYFKVAKGKTFEVSTELGKVTVLGTQFNVKARENRFDIVCYEGRVKVNYLNEEIILTQNESVAFENGKKIVISYPTNSKPSWTNNEISFSNENLKPVLKEIERTYNVSISITNEKTAKQNFTGSLPANNINAAIEIIASTYQLKVTKQKNEVYILEDLNANK